MPRCRSSARRCAARGRGPRAGTALFVLLTLARGATPQLAALPPANPGLGPSGLGARPLQTLLFVMAESAATADAGVVAGHGPTALGTLWSSNVATFTPGLDASARKVAATPEFSVLVGDANLDGALGEIHGGGLDALGVRRFDPPKGPLATPDFVFSTEDAWGTASEPYLSDGTGALDGTLFSLRRSWDGQASVVDVFLPEVLILHALGQPLWGEEIGDVDVDAFAQDEQGNVFLSFRHDELVRELLLEDDGVVCLPALQIGYTNGGNVVAVVPECAVIVLDKAGVNALVDAVGLQTVDGVAIHSIGDLGALEIDPAGGTFEPKEPIPGLPLGAPNLLFNGQRLGPTVLSTREGGTLATLGDRPLGGQVLDGGFLGLDPSTSSDPTDDLNAIAVIPYERSQLCVDVDHLDVDLAAGDEDVAFLLGNFAPHGTAWVLVSVLLPDSGQTLVNTLGPPGAAYPYLMLPQPMAQGPVALDALGRARLEIPLFPWSESLWVVLQAFEVNSGRLSTPAAVWCP